jgi:hypothetical protein
LYQTVAERWLAFRKRTEESGGLPKFVARELDEYLKCGIAEEAACTSCAGAAATCES